MKVLIAVIILLLLSTNAYALSWSDASTSVPSGSQYNPDQTYGYQIKWDAGGLEISEVIFELYIPGLGSSDNVTASNYSNIYYANLTNYIAPEYEYLYRWFAVDNESNWNVTEYFSFSLTKNTSAVIKLYLNGTETNRSYRKNELANFTAILNIPNKTIFLDSSYPGLNLYNDSSVLYHEVNLTTEGFFILNASVRIQYPDRT